MPIRTLAEQTAFRRMWHSQDGTAPDDALWYSENIVPVDGQLTTRPGMALLTAEVGTTGVAQGLTDFFYASGRHYVAVVNGEIWENPESTLAGWTRRITSANLATASITLSTTADCYFAVLNGKLVVSDSTNVPFIWDGTAGGGLTSLTNAPVLYGQPVIYYGKLFGIKNTERTAIVWSEENDSTIGYEAGGYNNAWSLTQTSQDNLTCLAATNTGLYYFRATSIGLVTGAVTPDFSTTGVHDSVSAESGCLDPRGPLQAYGALWFFDNNYRPVVLRDGVVLPIWKALMGLWGQHTLTQPYQATAFSGTLADLGVATNATQIDVIFAYPSIHAVGFVYQTTAKMTVILVRADGSPLCYLTNRNAGTVVGAILTRPTAAVGLTGNEVIFLGSDRSVGFFPGITEYQNTVGLADAWPSTANPYQRFITRRFYVSQDRAAWFTEYTLECERAAVSGSTTVSSFGLQYLTSDVQTIAGITTAQTVTSTLSEKETKTVGINGYGRWIAAAVTVNHSSTTNTKYARVHGLHIRGAVDAPDVALA